MEAEGGRISVRGEVAGGIKAAVRMIFVGPEVAEGIEAEVRRIFVGKCVSDGMCDEAAAPLVGRDTRSEFTEAHIDVRTFCLRLVEFFRVEAAFFGPATFTFAVGMRCCVICCCRRARDAREGRQV